MNISKDDADRLGEIATEMLKLLNEFKTICHQAMSLGEYQQFKYRTLGHLEPGLTDESEWITTYSSIDPLNKVAEKAAEEIIQCKKCGSPVDENGYCTNRNCNYFEIYQDEEDESPDNCSYCGSGLTNDKGNCQKCGL